MEVHAHSHTARKKWTHYFWEFLMLFLAVSLGFYAENTREVILHKKEVKTQLNSMFGKSGDTDQANPVQTDHPKLTSFSCHKKVVHLC